MRSPEINIPQKLRRRRAFTMVEMLIAIAIFSMILGTFTYMIIQTTRDVKRQMTYIQTNYQAIQAIDVMRGHLMSARFGTIEITNDGNRIEFTDPWDTTNTRDAFEFREDGYLYFSDDVDTGNWEKVVRYDLENVVFGTEISGSMITVEVTVGAQIHGGRGNVRAGLEDVPFVATAQFRVRSFNFDS